VVELGGEDAKIIFLTGGKEERMNGTCAGGTGAFIDQMASFLHVSIDELDSFALQAHQIYPIASRCGVFAKSDIQPLLNQGARKEDVAASIYQAVVGQTDRGPGPRTEDRRAVLFLGGPFIVLARAPESFRHHASSRSRSRFIFPKEGKIFMAMGASLYAEKTGKVPSLIGSPR
jgi:activator of 2-hydroxyglutaryl-CoA dehydratase